MTPGEARALLEAWRKEADAANEECAELQDELPDILAKCVEAKLEKKEIAKIAGLSRTTIHRYLNLKEVVK